MSSPTTLTKLSGWIDKSGIELRGGSRIVETKAAGLGLEGAADFGTSQVEVAVRVPHNLVLNSKRIAELAEKDPLLDEWIKVDNVTGTPLLHRGLLYLWLEKGESPWKDYLSSLPTDLELPFSYSIKKMERLEISLASLQYPALSKRLQIERAYERFMASGIAGDLTLEQWLVPHLWISSRGLTHPTTEETCLVPIIDLCNHSSHSSNVRYDIDSEGSFELLTVPEEEEDEKGAKETAETDGSPKRTFSESRNPDSNKTERRELLLNYGERSNSEFVFNYGFLPNDRTSDDFDQVFMPIDPSSDEVRDILDLSRTMKGISADEKTQLAEAYDVLLDFFSESYVQMLRLVRFPTKLEPNEDKRYKFHNNFIMALASDDYLEVREVDDRQALFFEDGEELHPDTVFDAAVALKDDKVMEKARGYVAKLARLFEDKLVHVREEEKDSVICQLVETEIDLFRHYSKSDTQ